MDEKILLVEDNVFMLDELEIRLIDLGYKNIEKAISGKEAIDIAKRWNPDLVISDINLGDGMDGIDAIKQINSSNNIPVIYLTAYDDDITVERAQHTEPYAYITKPVKEKELSIAIKMAIYKHETDKKLAESELRLKRIFDSSQVGILITKNRKLVYANPYICMLLEYSKSEMVDKDARFLYPSQDDYEYVGQVKFPALQKEGIATVQTKFITSKGKVLDVLMNSSFLDRNDKLEGVISVVADITKQKEYERSLDNKNKEKDLFISIMAHDVKNTLSTNLQLVELLCSGKLDQNKSSTFLSHLNVNLKKTLELLDSLVEWGKASQNRESYYPELLIPHDRVSQLEHLFQVQISNKLLSIKNNVDERISISADKNMFDFILRNLIFNAIKYTQQKGVIEISCISKEDIYEFCVSDTGIGIPLHRLKELFSLKAIVSSLGTNGEEGHGLGLQIIKEYVRLHNGKIWAESEDGKGTRVFFTIAKSF